MTMVESPQYVLGFRVLANLLKRDIVGDPLENEHHNPENGDGLQQTTNGLMVWRKADNWTAFTDGYQTWINGPLGIQKRLNDERFEWERPPAYFPTIYHNRNPSTIARRSFHPWGILLHGSHSTRRRSEFLEFHGTRAYAISGADGLAWWLTVMSDAVAEHHHVDEWGWHCRRPWSEAYVGIEFAKAQVEDHIPDESVRAAAWAIREWVLPVYPNIPLDLPCHSEIWPGITDGKVDPYPLGDGRNDYLRRRIQALL